MCARERRRKQPGRLSSCRALGARSVVSYNHEPGLPYQLNVIYPAMERLLRGALPLATALDQAYAHQPPTTLAPPAGTWPQVHPQPTAAPAVYDPYAPSNRATAPTTQPLAPTNVTADKVPNERHKDVCKRRTPEHALLAHLRKPAKCTRPTVHLHVLNVVEEVRLLVSASEQRSHLVQCRNALAGRHGVGEHAK